MPPSSGATSASVTRTMWSLLMQRRGARLAAEPLDRRSWLLREDLQRQALSGVLVLHLVDGAHSPLAEEAHRPVFAANPRRKVEVGHVHLPNMGP